jgi:inhibitor of cysteine peptidase
MNKMWLAILYTSLVIVSITLLSNASSQIRKITLFGEPKIMIQHGLSTENIKNKRDDIASKIIFVNSTMENKKQENITVKKGQEFTIIVESNPTTGYQWIPTFNTSIINLISHNFQPSAKLIGSSGADVFTFKAVNYGTGSLKMLYKRSWEKDFVKEKVFAINVT